MSIARVSGSGLAASRALTVSPSRSSETTRRAVVGADIVNGENVRVAQRADGLRLLFQPPDQFRVVRARSGYNLDRHVALQPIVPGPIHFAHPARTQLADDLVWTQTRAGTQRHTGFWLLIPGFPGFRLLTSDF